MFMKRGVAALPRSRAAHLLDARTAIACCSNFYEFGFGSNDLEAAEQASITLK